MKRKLELTTGIKTRHRNVKDFVKHKLEHTKGIKIRPRNVKDFVKRKLKFIKGIKTRPRNVKDFVKRKLGLTTDQGLPVGLILKINPRINLDFFSSGKI